DGRGGGGTQAVRPRRDAPDPGAPLGPGGGALLRGLLERHALAPLPRRRRAARVLTRVLGRLPRGERAVRAGRGGRGRSGRRRLDPGLPPAAGAHDPAPVAARPEDRLLPAHPVPADRALLPAPVAERDRRRAARRRPRRLPAAGRGLQLPPALPAPPRAAHPP